MFNIIEFISVAVILLSSGSLFFNILNMELSMFVLLGLAFVYLLKYKKIDMSNLRIFIIILIILLFNSILNVRNGINVEDGIILFIRILSLMIIQSNITASNFKKHYINIVYYLAIISLICYIIIIINPNFKLPFEYVAYKNSSQYILTFYYTKGWRTVFDRNSGLFWEPGVYQIYLNIALLFIVTNKNEIKNMWRKILILFITIITTFSTTGYICFIMVCIYALIVSGSNKKITNKLKLLVPFILVGFIIYEANYNIISYKLIDKQGSYVTREKDSISTLKLALERPILGYGALNTVTTDLLYNNYGVLYNSNGLGSFLISFGLPISSLYIIRLYYSQRKLLYNKSLSSIISILIFIIFFNSESVMVFTIFLSFMFNWKHEYNQCSDYLNIGG